MRHDLRVPSVGKYRDAFGRMICRGDRAHGQDVVSAGDTARPLSFSFWISGFRRYVLAGERVAVSVQTVASDASRARTEPQGDSVSRAVSDVQR